MMENKVVNIIKKRVEKAKEGTLLFANSFPQYDDEYVGQVLSGLVAEGTLHRLCRGVYLKTKATRFGLVYPTIEEIATAIAQRDNAKVLPTGATALNQLGLSEQVPMNPVFLTSGSARNIKLGNRTISFKRAVPKNFAVKGKRRRLIVQAMKAIGEGNMTEQERTRLVRLITNDSETATLEADLRAMPVWVRKFFTKTLKENGKLSLD